MIAFRIIAGLVNKGAASLEASVAPEL
jgi:hypothetical protein